MSKPRILIVEDEPFVARDIRQQLVELGYEPVADTPLAEEAISLAGQLRPDLVLMDIHLEGKTDGITAAQVIHDRFNLPVVFLTAFAGEETLDRAKKSDPFGYIIKPFDERELRTVIEMALYKHQAESQLRQGREEQAAILRTTLDGFWLVDMQGHILDVNEACCRMLGYTRDEMLGMSLSDFEAEETADEIAAGIERLQQVGSALLERRHRCKDGHLIDVEVSINYIPGDTGRFSTFIRDITERKQMEHALRSSEERATKTFRTIPDGIVISRLADGQVIEVNESFCRLSGWSREEIIGHSVLELALWDQATLRDSYLENLRQHGRVKDFEAPLRTKSGKIRIITLSAELMDHDQDKLVLAITHDITESKQADERLRLSEQTHSGILNSITEAVYIQDENGLFLDVNLAVEKMYGYAKEEFIGRSPEFLSAPGKNDFSKIGTYLEKALNGEPQSFEFWGLRKDGTIFPKEVSVTPGYYFGEKVNIAVARDTTERKQAEEAIRESEETYRSILNASPDDITITDLEGRILMVSPAAHAMFGYAPGEEIGLRLFDFIVPEDLERARSNLTLMHQGGYRKPNEYRGIRKDRSLFDIEVNSGFIRDIHGQPTQMVFIVRDITERKQADDELRRAMESLRRSETKFRTLYDSDPDGVMLLDERGFFDCNAATLETFGCASREEFFSKHPADLSPALQPCGTDSMTLANQRIAAAMKTGNQRFEWVHKRADTGAVFSAEVLLNAMELDGRRVLQAVVRDITERKRAEEALRENEDRYRDLVENAQELISIYDLDGNILSTNETTIRNTGYSREALLKMNLVDLVAPETRHLVPAYYKTLQTHGKAHGILRIQTASGEKRFWEYDSTVRTDGLDRPIVRGMSLDITERRAAEKALRASESQLKVILESTDDGILAVDHQGKILKTNSRFADLWKIPQSVIANGERQALLDYVLPQVSDPEAFLKKAHSLQESDATDLDVIHLRDGRSFERLSSPMLEGSVITGRVSSFRDITERKRAEQALQESLERFQLANRATFNVIWDWDLKTKAIWRNDNFQKMFGYSKDELGASFDDSVHIIPPEDLERVQAGLQMALEAGKDFWADQYRFRRKDGSYATVEDRAIITRDAEGRAIRMLGAMQDISDRIQSEKALKNSEEKLRMIIEHSSQLYYSHGPDNVITYVSPQVNEFFDAGPEDTFRPWTDFLTDNPVNAIGMELTRKAIETGLRQSSYELELISARGRKLWVEVHESPVVQSGKTIAMVGALTDITERKQANDQLRLQGTALEAAANAITITDRAGLIQWVNPAFTTLTGYSSSEAIGKRPGDLVKSGAHDQAFYVTMWTVLNAGEVWRGDLTNRRKDGSIYIGEKIITPLIDGLGRITNFTSVEQDVTERKQAEATLRLQGSALEAAANAIVITDRDGVIEWANAAFTKLTEYSLIETIGDHPGDLLKSGEQDEGFYKVMWDTILAGEVWRGELVNKRKDGTRYTEEMTITPLRNDDGEITHFIAVKQDITSRKQAERELSHLNRSLKMLSACNEALVRGDNELELLKVICQIAVEIGGYRMAWVGYAQDDAEQTILPMAFAGVELGYLSEVQITWSENDSRGMGPAGRAVRSGQASLFRDITSDPASFHWLDAAQRRGYRGVISLPLRDENRIFGVLNLYGAEPLDLAGNDIELLKEMADDLAFGIGNIHAQIERKRMASLLDKAQDAILVRDLENRILFWNKGAERLYGWTAEEMIGHIPLDDVYDDLGRFDEAQRLVLQDGEWNGQILQRRKDGDLLTVEGHWTLVRDEAGQAKSVLAINTDITEKVEAERELQQYTDRLEAMREIDVALLGARSTPELARGALTRLRHIVPFERAAVVLFDSALLEGTLLAVDQDHPWLPLAGEVRPVGDFHDLQELRSAPFLSLPDLSLLQGCIMEELMLSQGLRSLVYLPMETEGTLLGFVALSATTPGVLTPKHAEIALDMTDQLVVAIQHLRLKEELELANQDLESKVEQRTVDLRTTVATMEVLEQELVKREADARAANEAKSTFLASMSHELRTPLIGVTGMLEILGATRLDAEQRQIASIIRESSQSLLQIIGDILDFSKIEAGKLELALQTFSARDLVESIAQVFNSACSAKGLDFVVELDPDIAPAHVADVLRIRQVLNNFMSNAVKFTERGSIALRLRRRDTRDGRESLAFEVEDSGIGVSPENQARLFEPFTQAEASTTRRFGGTGLGLAISRRLAELMGGSLTMHSGSGQGTRMTLVLDLMVGNVEDIAKTGESEPSISLLTRPMPSIETAVQERSLVLLAEDHPTNRIVLTQQVNRAGFALEVAEDGQEAFEKWQSGRYALLLTDLHMPRMDGYQLTRAVRDWERKHELRRTPILALTANAMGGEAERCLELGMDDYLIKPVTIPLLASKLHAWMPHVKFDEAPVAALMDAASSPEWMPGVDSKVLLDLCGGNADSAKEILADFITTSRTDLKGIQDGLARQDKPSIVRQSHRIKGSAAMIGARDLSQRAANLEAYAKKESAQWSTIQENLAGLQKALAELERTEWPFIE